MLSKIKSSKITRIRLLIILRVIMVLLGVFACNKSEPNSYNNVQELAKDVNTLADSIHFEVETMPEYPGGNLELRKFIAQNIKYPELAKNKGIAGRVFVQFVVTKTGDISTVEIVRGVNALLDNEAKRVVSLQPKWKPGEQDGEKVNVSFTIPINFKLD